MVTKKTPKVVLTAVAIVIAAYILSPFYLVLINTFKNANGIVANPDEVYPSFLNRFPE